MESSLCLLLIEEPDAEIYVNMYTKMLSSAITSLIVWCFLSMSFECHEHEK